jgi:peroxiredoxin
MPKVGDVAPDFTLKHFDGNNLTDVKLSDYRGKKNVVLAFYVFAFTGG